MTTSHDAGRDVPWHSPLGSLLEAQSIARQAYKLVERGKAINGHIPGNPYDVAMSALNSTLAALDTLITTRPPAQAGAASVEEWTFTPDDREKAALLDLCADQDLSPKAVMRQAVRLYQSDHLRRKAGETVAWSGDEQRAREFVGSLATPAASGEIPGGMVEDFKRLHEAARGCEFDLTPADGAIARLTIFVHKHGDAIVAALSTPAASAEMSAVDQVAAIIDPDAFATYPFDPDRGDDFIDAVEAAADEARRKAADIIHTIAALSTPKASAETGEAEERYKAHFERMQDMMRRYIEPITYVASFPADGTKYASEFEEPGPHDSATNAESKRRCMDRAFIADMIHMMDGPEQRALSAAPSAPATEAGEEV